MEIELFMRSYLYELEDELKKNLDYFKDIIYQLDEANSDKEIKVKIKEFILEKMPKVKTICNVTNEAGNTLQFDKSKFEIVDVKVPDELNNDDKEYIKNCRTAVYTNPDLLFYISDGKKIYRVSLEVKTTLKDAIPGSSIQQIDESDWVIFIKHDENGIIDITTGKYMNSINGTMQFPDRSPRPQVSYNNLKKWNQLYRSVSRDTIKYNYDPTIIEKQKMLKDWQLLLSERWMNVLKGNRKLKNEPWFNNNIRKFSITLLNYYDSLSNAEKEKFKNSIYNNIIGGNDE